MSSRRTPHGRWPGPRVLRRCLAAALVAAPTLAAAAAFQAEGSDTGAGLASVAGGEVAVSRQLNARLHPVNFLGVAWQLRLAVGLSPQGLPAWSMGLYVERIDCKSTFCGVDATSNGFTTQSTGAKATGLGLAQAFWRFSSWGYPARLWRVPQRPHPRS